MGLTGTSSAIRAAVEKTIQDGIVTYDLARQLENGKAVKCSEFGKEVTKRL
ncbi:MAG: isocitrate/isopropylmalate family dehydrogenase [Syntrophorhabdaceae bacterium]